MIYTIKRRSPCTNPHCVDGKERLDWIDLICPTCHGIGALVTAEQVEIPDDARRKCRSEERRVGKECRL